MPASRNRFLPDALLNLQPEGSASVTASGASVNSLFFPATPNAEYWPISESTMNRVFGVSLNVTAFAGTGSAKFDLQADTTGAFTNPVVVGSVTVPSADLGVVDIAVDKQTLEAFKEAATNFRVYVTLDGVTGVTYSAYMTDLKSL